ncbi:MAG TPA: CocE/NonD family hydrolase [Candidatus Binataceae bacterium]|nr:CocE/NonD family hydrolase [Candidatus Binataceae bacterium]
MANWIPKAYKIVKEENVPARMRDGVTLRADVYRPDAPGRYPVVLMRTPYGKEATAPNAKRFVPYGYVLVTQDTRGRFDSEGDCYYPLIHEGNDGYDTVEWAAQLPCSNGSVATYGQSYLCATQYLMAPTRPPHLRAMFATSAPSDWHECWVYRGTGVLDFGWLLPYCLMMTPDQLKRKGTRHLLEAIRGYYPDPAEMSLWAGLKEEHFSHLPIYDWAERLAESMPYLKDYFDHPEDDAYWRQINVRHKAHDVAVPIFHVASWYDGFLEGGLHYFSAIRQHGYTPEARAGQRLLVGPWPHLYPYDSPSSKVGELDLGPEALIRVGDMALRWFDYWLKGIDSGIAGTKPVNIFVMGDNTWREEDEWPLARTKYTPFYLHGAGKANTLNGDGGLSQIPPHEERSDSFVYDPNDPAPTRGGSQLGPNPTGPCDQRPVEARQDVLVYTSEPLTTDLEITGPIAMKLFAASSATDTDFTAKLVDVWPNGYAQNIQDGIVRARYRNSKTHPVLLTPDEVCEYTIDLWATSHVVKPGHRIRVEISSSNFPHYDRNPNTGGPLFKENSFKRATQTIFHDAGRPSHIILPIIPR